MPVEPQHARTITATRIMPPMQRKAPSLGISFAQAAREENRLALQIFGTPPIKRQGSAAPELITANRKKWLDEIMPHMQTKGSMTRAELYAVWNVSDSNRISTMVGDKMLEPIPGMIPHRWRIASDPDSAPPVDLIDAILAVLTVEPISLADLSTRLTVNRTKLTQALESLEAENRVQSITDKHGRRVYNLARKLKTTITLPKTPWEAAQ